MPARGSRRKKKEKKEMTHLGIMEPKKKRNLPDTGRWVFGLKGKKKVKIVSSLGKRRFWSCILQKSQT